MFCQIYAGGGASRTGGSCTKKRYIFIFVPILTVLLMALIYVAYVYYYLISTNVISIGWNKTNLGPSWGYAKKYAMKSEFSRIDSGTARPRFTEVYCDDEFSFKEAGVLKGAFILPKDTFFYGLTCNIIIPELYSGYGTVDGIHYYYALVQIPATVIFEWDGKDGKRKRAESSLDRYFEDKNTEGSACNYTYDGRMAFKYVPIPRNKKIDYTLIYEKGTYLKDRGYPLLYDLQSVPDDSERGKHTEVVDKSELLETEPKFWKAHFVVGEHTIKGEPDRSRKPAKD